MKVTITIQLGSPPYAAKYWSEVYTTLEEIKRKIRYVGAEDKEITLLVPQESVFCVDFLKQHIASAFPKMRLNVALQISVKTELAEYESTWDVKAGRPKWTRKI